MCFGGHGYIREWGMEQCIRDLRISQIYEGTNGVQSQDLIGRKTIKSGGAFIAEYIAEIRDFANTLRSDLNFIKDATLDAATEVEAVTQFILNKQQKMLISQMQQPLIICMLLAYSALPICLPKLQLLHKKNQAISIKINLLLLSTLLRVSCQNLKLASKN
jgi:hypothetical protein